MDTLVTTEWLASQLTAKDLRVVDATYFANLPGEPPRDARAEYAAAHIPGAVFLDLGELRDINNPLPMMLPGHAKAVSRLQPLGIGDSVRVVLYDNSSHRTAARAWWMLRQFGVAQVAILDGGLQKWTAEERPLASGIETGPARRFTARGNRADVRTLDQVRQALLTADAQVVDARSPARFAGDEPDPRPGVAAGHMPGARNLPYGTLFEADGTYKRGDALRAAFDAAGVDVGRRVIATCGSGITAAPIVFALHLLGEDAALYDGSWSEWGADPTTPKATGAD